MSLTFTADGLTIQTYDEIYAELAAGYRAIYGADINLDADSPDGQRVAIEAKERLDLQAFALSLYNQLDPDFSSGEFLNKIIKFSGITRQPASRSYVDVTITTNRVLTLPAGYAVEDALGQIWITTESASLVSGANTVTLVAQNFGQVEADAATITIPSTIIIGVVSVTNPLAATAGREEETDEQLRIRRNKSLESPASSTRGGMYGVLANIPGVTDLQVYENDTDTTDANGIPSHSLWIVVEGGTVADIVEAIAKNKTGGTGLKGIVTGTYTETLIRPDGSELLLYHLMKFDRPTDVPLYITLDVTLQPGAVLDAPLIKESLARKTFTIGEFVSAGGMYQYVHSPAYNGTNEQFTPSNLLVSRDNITYTVLRIDPAINEKFSISTANITVTDITPP